MLKTQLRLHFIVLLWGFTGIMGKLISISAIPLVFWRTFIATISIFVLLKILGISVKISQKKLLQYLGVGAITGLHWVLFFGAIKVSNISVALSTLSTGALFAAFLEPIFYKRKIKISEIVLSTIVILCLWAIFQASPQYKTGIIMGISCAFLSALMAILNGVLQKDNSNRPRIMILYEMLGACIFVGIMMPLFNSVPQDLVLQKLDIIWLVVLGAGLTAYPIIESVALMRYISPYTLVLAVNLEPVYGILLAYIIWGESEQMSSTFYVAVAVMILVIIINGIYQTRQKKKQLNNIT